MKSLRVLIAEDDPPVAAMLTDILDDLGYEVSVVLSLEHMVQVAPHVRPHVVLVGLDGRGNFAPGWRAGTILANLLPGTPLVMIATSDAAVEEIGLTLRSRAFRAALLKPFSIDKLTAIIDSLCQDSVKNIATSGLQAICDVEECQMMQSQRGYPK